jgi:ADP-ribose pyrophosphatase YjhB (NUDIX family)
VAADAGLRPEDIDWPARQARALVPFDVADGRPRRPAGPTGRGGLGGMDQFGENPMADALVVAIVDGERWLLMVERDDELGWAVPGGGIEDGESWAEAAVRELAEETRYAVTDPSLCRPLRPRCVDDPRGTDEAWPVTVPAVIDLGRLEQLPAVTGGSDARRAAWIPALTYEGLAGTLDRDYGGTVFQAHVDMLGEFLGRARI